MHCMNAQFRLEPVVSLGTDGKGSFCVQKSGAPEFFDGYGDLSLLSNYSKFCDAVNAFNPRTVICDLNPAFNTSRLAMHFEKKGCRVFRVQHHIAHAYAAAAEFKLDDFAAIVCDGFGYGLDGHAWGGEVFLNSKRVGSLEEQVLPGGDASTLNPERFLASILLRFLDREQVHLATGISLQDLAVLALQIEQGFNCVKTTSAGRILDAVSFLLCFCQQRTYEGEPAILLEKNSSAGIGLKPVFEEAEGRRILKTTPLFQHIYSNLHGDRRALAFLAQVYIAEGLYRIAKGKRPIVFTGGCAVNKIMSAHLEKKEVLTAKNCTDSGVSIGQLEWHRQFNS